MTVPILRPYQVSAIEKLRETFRSGKRRIVLVSPTGSGKTILFCAMVRDAVYKGKRAVVLVHRRELVDQTYDKLKMFGISAGVIQGQNKLRDDWLPVQICSVQTLARRGNLPPADLVIVDEAQHAMSNTWKAVIKAYQDAFILGATATPWRSDRKGLDDIFEGQVVAATPSELMTIGSLVDYDCFAYDAPDLHEIRITAGDYNGKDLGLAANTNVLVGNIVEEYIKHALGKRAVVFAVNIAHSEHLVAEFCNAGIKAAHIDCETPALKRSQTLKDFADNRIHVLVSVAIFTEGWDCPAAEVCILARPTKSLSLFIQMVGRVLRPFPGKNRALIHDHSGNSLRHGLIDDERDYSLTATPERTRLLSTCPFCNAVQGASKMGLCKVCGQLITEPQEPRSTSPSSRAEKQTVEGLRISAEEIRAMRERGVRSDLTDMQLSKAKNASSEEKRAEYLRLQKVADKKGYRSGWAKHSFRQTFGHWPNYSEDQLKGIFPAQKPFFPLQKKDKPIESTKTEDPKQENLFE
jgi:DNA repair protein RadD